MKMTAKIRSSNFQFFITLLYIDVNECSPELEKCGSNSQCVNTDGSFSCRCNEGYTGNGVTCTGKWYILNNLRLFCEFSHFLHFPT